MKETRYHIVLDEYSRRSLIALLNNERNERIKGNQPFDDISDIYEKVVTAPNKRVRIIERETNAPR